MNPSRNSAQALHGWQVSYEPIGFERWQVLYVYRMRFDGKKLQKAEGHGRAFASPEECVTFCLRHGYMRLVCRNTIIFHRSRAFVKHTGKVQWYPDPKFSERLNKGACAAKSNKESKRLARWQDARDEYLDGEDSNRKIS